MRAEGLSNSSIDRIRNMLRGGAPVWLVPGLKATITKVYGKHVQEDLKLAANVSRRPR